MSQFEQVAILENWTNEKNVVLLKLNLKDKVLNFVMNDQKAANEKDFENLKILLINKFSHTQSFEISNLSFKARL